jgi:histidine ammonia-lyase
MTSVTVDGRPLRIEDVCAVASRRKTVHLSDASDFRARIVRGAELVAELLSRNGVIYGVNTGYGDSVTVSIPAHLVSELPRKLYTYHGVGLGLPFGPIETRAILLARLQSLSQGFSGVRYELLVALARLLREDLLPVIPQEGSVGASGDLTPLSYVAAVLSGEREVMLDGERLPARDGLARRGLTPIELWPKEALALMNGTAVMTGLACLAFDRARTLSVIAAHLTAMASAALSGNPQHFDQRLFEAKPHAGQRRVAGWIRAVLAGASPADSHLQDRYSIRCAPHVVGVLEDALPFLRDCIENELNSANDNPLIDSETGRVLHGGHFYGGHVALAMDTLKNAVANVADLLDRQLALLVDARFNHGLPANLSGATGERAVLNHGLKALQISSSAWTAEALKGAVPASLFSRSTESHNQDKVSLGTIAARDALRVLELTEQVAAAHAIATRQAVFLRTRLGRSLPPAVVRLAEALPVAPVIEDRALESDLRAVIDALRNGTWPGEAGLHFTS